MNLKDIESRFIEITGLSSITNLSIYPLTEHIGFEIRDVHKKDNGEVFTPLELVDRMLEISKPEPDKFNMDLCAGRGQFTVRILRKFQNQSPDFDIDYYLKNFHWFNELNVESCKELIYIFGENINLCIGDSRKLKLMQGEVWDRGIFIFNSELNKWLKISIEELNNFKIEEETKTQSSKKLF